MSKKTSEALEYSFGVYKGIERKVIPIPGFTHPLNSGNNLIAHGITQESLIISAYLHDLIEDTHVTRENIAQIFGEIVARIVEAVSDSDKSMSWEERKQAKLEKLQNAPIEVLMVVCAEKLDGIRSIRQDLARLGEELWNRFSRPKEKQEWYYRSLVSVLKNRMEDDPRSSSLFKEFAQEVDEVFGNVVEV